MWRKEGTKNGEGAKTDTKTNLKKKIRHDIYNSIIGIFLVLMIVIILLPAVEAGSGSNNQQILNTPTGQGQGQGQGQGYQGQQGQQGEQGEQYWRTIQEYYPTQAQELFYGIYPNETVISTIIDVTYSKAEMEYLYILDYSAAFVFNNTENITVYIPLPAGSIEDLVILVNNEPIGHPTIKSNQVIVPLYAVDAPHTLNVAYLAQGTDLYAHYIPKNVFLDKFYVEIELKNVRYDKRIPDNCLTPDEFISSNPSSYFKWDKENTILKEDITLEISTPDEDKVQVKEEKKEIPWNKIFIIGSTLLVFCLIIALFYYHAFKQPAGRWKLNVSYLFMPVVIMYVLLGIMIQHVDVLIAGLSSIVLCVGMMFLINTRSLRIMDRKWCVFLVPSFSLICASGMVFFFNYEGFIFASIPLIGAAILYLHFLKANKNHVTIRKIVKKLYK